MLTAWMLVAAPADGKDSDYCWVPNRMKYVGRDSLIWYSKDEAQQRENEAARMERREPRQVEAGWVAVHIERTSLEGADPSKHLVLVTRDGAELFRLEPPSVVPDSSMDPWGFWYSYAVAQLPAGLEPPFEVTAVDRLQMAQCRWSVGADGVVVMHKLTKDERQAAAP